MLLVNVLASSTFHQVVLVMVALVQLAAWLSIHWKVKNKTVERLPYGVVDNWLEKRFPGYTKNGKLL